MRAAILANGKLSIKDVPKPSPGYEEALVKITTAGVCHSDLHMIKGDWGNVLPPVPIPMGHEGIGIVEELGTGAEKYVKKGDRVILGMGGMGGGYWCGACEYCLSGRPHLCSQARNTLGAYAEFISVWVKSLVRLPDEVSDREVPLACGGLTSYSAVKKLFKYDVLPGKVIAIVGAAGGLGHYAVQVAKAFGYPIIGISAGQEKVEFTKKLGVDFAVDVADAEQFIKNNIGGVYASIVLSSKIAGYELGLKILKRGGVFVGVGIPALSEGRIPLTPVELLMREPLIVPSVTGTVEEMRELVQLAAAGKVKTHIGRVASLSEIDQVLGDLEQGKYAGRAIIDSMTK